MKTSVRAIQLSWRHLCLVLCLALVPLAVVANPPDFTAIVDSQGPAVVNIASTAAAPALPPIGSLPGIEGSEEWLELLRRFFPQFPDLQGGEGERDRSLGSGFIVSADGYILTNAHVVAGAEEIVVRLVDKREFNAEVIGTDARSDVAVIRIQAQNLPVVRLGDPRRLKVGEWVLAIGSPFGFEHSVTAGIVSAKGRALPDENFVPFIQTDVAINPGNSGGPLFNLRGEVVGINSQIYSDTGGFMGLSFAIPIDVALDVYRQLRSDGRVRRGRIGVGVQELTRALADSFGLASPEGALVSNVEPDGPAARAGVQIGDVIVRFDGKPVPDSTALPRIVAEKRPGANVTMSVVRGGKPLELRLTVGEWSDDKPAATAPVQTPVPDRLGLVLSRPDEATRRDRGIERGLLVDSVQGAAARAGLQAGDVIVAIVTNGRQTPLESVEQFEKLVAGIEDGGAVTLLVQRGSGTSFISLRTGR
ncbi:DegQ family serine endoprotease [Pseudazoarcus pumilus]|uniref:Probable periplasmic serine endoprotease DegP-like n=1 Tax=Pseudazoarcus pumilus TaxID=2067960 RepID=A0A2I6S538_9RHOO|nr:DegQ family serine endoprotease [Pseudazoarcus pumilus]AUN94376.1 protease Do [Pseudazoarcus pumilus]